jgi:hypothetical protein
MLIICDLRKSRTLGRKVSDEFTVPLCRGHNREIRRCGKEAAWWKKPVLIRPFLLVPCGWKVIR